MVLALIGMVRLWSSSSSVMASYLDTLLEILYLLRKALKAWLADMPSGRSFFFSQFCIFLS